MIYEMLLLSEWTQRDCQKLWLTGNLKEGKERGHPWRTWKDGIYTAMRSKRSKNGRMEQPKATEYGSRKASPDVLKPHIYIYIYIYIIITWGTWLLLVSACMKSENKLMLRKWMLLILLLLQGIFQLSQINFLAIQNNFTVCQHKSRLQPNPFQ